MTPFHRHHCWGEKFYEFLRRGKCFMLQEVYFSGVLGRERVSGVTECSLRCGGWIRRGSL